MISPGATAKCIIIFFDLVFKKNSPVYGLKFVGPLEFRFVAPVSEHVKSTTIYTPADTSSLVTQGWGVCARGPLGLNAPMAS